MKSGSLRRRANRSWQYRGHFGSHPDGRPRTRSKSFPASLSQAAAEKQARAVRAVWDAEEAADLATKGTVAELVQEWARTRRDQSPTTEYRYRSIVAAILADLGRIRLSNLTARDVDRWYLQLAKTRSGNTVRHYHRVLRAVLQQGVKWDMVDRNVADRATPPPTVKRDQAERMPTVAALTAMLANANRTVRMAVLLAAATGCRRGELVGLAWSDIDNGVLTVQRALYQVPGGKLGVKATKSGTVKRIPLNRSLFAELTRFRTASYDWCETNGYRLADDGPILAHLRADATGRTPFSPDWLSQEWERLCTRSKVAAFKLHGIRHLHASALHDAGGTSAAIAGRLGHASIATTETHYTHAMPAGELELAATVEEVFGPLFA